MKCGNCGARGHWADQCESSRATPELDAYAYAHGATFAEAFGRTDDGYEEIDE